MGSISVFNKFVLLVGKQNIFLSQYFGIFLHCSDDSLGYEFPFVLRVVEREGLQCAWCPWYKFCRGCQLPCDDKIFPQNAAFLAIDWDPTALHLRYQSALERVCMVVK